MRIHRMVAALMALALVLAACGGSSTSTTAGGDGSTTTAGGSTDSTAPSPGGVKEVVILASGDPPDFDPHTSGATEKSNVVHNVYDSLTMLDADQTETLPALATEWELIDDLTWEFKLREGVKFHNGEDFTAEDVKFSAERLHDPNAEVARLTSSLPDFDHAEVIDDYTVRIHTKSPDPILPQRIYGLLIVPNEYTASISESEFAMSPVGTGPYKLAEYVPGQRIVMEANDDYWGGRPKVDRLVIRPVPEPSTRVAELQTGGADIIQQAPVAQMAEIEASGNARVEVRDGRRVAFVGLDLLPGGPEALQDKRVRHALNHAVDVDLILQTINEGYGTRLATNFRPDFFGFDPNAKPFEHDPEKAKQLLAEAGYAEGLTLSFQTSDQVFPGAVEVVQALAEQLRAVGITVNVDVVDHATFRSIVIAGQEAHETEDMYAWNWGALDPDPDSPLSGTLHCEGISSYYCNPELDALIESGRREMDRTKRAEIYRQVQALLLEEAPFIFLFQIPDVYGVSNRVVFEPRLDQYILGQFLDVNE
jgi:peptide/nickel transport system substrate-binding protein